LDRVDKFKSMRLKKADAAADIDLINRYSVKQLTPDEVYCFSLTLADNDVDRDMERFPNATLEALAPLFLGKTGISDHRWSAEKQIARLYRVETADGEGTTKTGDPVRLLRGSAYMLKNEQNQPMIDAIDGGILKEVSIGCAVSKCNCSLCGERLALDWRTYRYQCENGHIKGEEYDGKLCVGDLVDPTDAYEFSFVAVPSQRGAGVTKGAKDLDDAFERLMNADLRGQSEKVKQLMPRLQAALTDDAERLEREQIRKYAEQFR